MNQTTPAEDRLEFKLALPLFMLVMLDAFSLTVILPLLPYYATAFGIGYLGIGALLATSPLLELISSPLYGMVSSRLGRRPVLIVSQIGTFFGFLVLGAASTTWMLFLARVIDGISSGNNTIGRRLIRDSLTPLTRTHAMGLIEAAYSLGFLAGPLVGIGVLALSGENYRLVPYIAALISLVPIIISLFIAQETLPPEKRASSGLSFREKLAAKYSPLKQRVVLLLLVLLFIAQFAFVGFVEYFGLYTLFRLGLNVLSVMILFFAAAILIIAVQGWVVDKLSRRYGDRRLTLIGFHVLAVGLILAAFTPSMPVPWYSKSEIVDELTLEATFTGEVMVDPLTTDLPLESGEGYLGIAWFIFSLCLIVIGYGLIVPAIQSRVMANAPEIAGGSLLGVSNAFYKFILISAPLVLGFAFTTFGLTAPFLLEGLLLLLLFWLIGLQLRAET